MTLRVTCSTTQTIKKMPIPKRYFRFNFFSYIASIPSAPTSRQALEYNTARRNAMFRHAFIDLYLYIPRYCCRDLKLCFQSYFIENIYVRNIQKSYLKVRRICALIPLKIIIQYDYDVVTLF